MTSATSTDPDAGPAPLWEAPVVAGLVDATVDVPGSKSLTNRLLVLAALAQGPGTLRGALRSRDADLMIAALRSLGATISEGDAPSTLHVSPAPVRGDVEVFTGLAGTVMRFLPAVAALADGPVRFDGDPEARVRPMHPILAALHALGVRVTGDYPEPPTHLPFTVHGTGAVRGGAVDVDASASSQFVSGLLLAAPRFDDGLALRHIGPTL